MCIIAVSADKLHDNEDGFYFFSSTTGDKMIYDALNKRFDTELKSIGTVRVKKEIESLKAVRTIETAYSI